MTDEYRHRDTQARKPATARGAARIAARERWVASAAVVLMPLAAWALGELAVELSSWATEPGAGVDAILAPAIVGLGAAVCGYLALTALAMVGAALSGTIPAWIAAFAPAAWRRIVATAAGVTLSAGLAVPALAADIAPGWTTAVATAGVDAAPGWASAGSPARTTVKTDALPGWIDGPAVASSAQSTPSASTTELAESTPQAAASVHQVKAGESLWGITADLLDTSEAVEVASAWPALYEANRAVIGDDPDVILPGQELQIPSELGR